MELSSDEEFVPEEVSAIAKEAKEELIPQDSKEQYDRTYQAYINWKKKMNCRSNAEDVVLGYIKTYAKNVKSSTLWAHFSMLKTTLRVYDNVDIAPYHSVIAFLKKEHKGYVPKQSKVLSPEHVKKFITEAPDERYLDIKVSYKT